MNNVYKYELKSADVLITADQVLRGMGYIEQSAPEYLVPLVEKFLHEAADHLQLQAGFRIFETDISLEQKRIVIEDVELMTHKIINRHLKGSDKLVLFAATAGSEFDNWIQGFYKSGDQLEGYIVDTIGSELVESAGDWLEKELQKIVKPENCSNRLSPGYCSWSVADQHKLFSLLPENFLGISLTDTALMQPVKSISGIIGVGESIRRMDYQCNICNLENCYKRIRDVRQSEN